MLFCQHHPNSRLEYICTEDSTMICKHCASSLHASHSKILPLIAQAKDIAIQAQATYEEAEKALESHGSEINRMRGELQMIHDKIKHSVLVIEKNKYDLLNNMVKELDSVGKQWVIQEENLAIKLAQSISDNEKHEAELEHSVHFLSKMRDIVNLDSNEKVIWTKNVAKNTLKLVLTHSKHYHKLNKPYTMLLWPDINISGLFEGCNFAPDTIEQQVEEAEQETSILLGYTPRLSYYSVLAAGQNNYYQLGMNGEPFKVHSILYGVSDVKKLQASYRGYCMYLNNKGEVYTKGNGNGYLGHGDDISDQKQWKKLDLLEGYEIADICCGWNHTIMRSSQGHVFVCGDGTDGQLVSYANTKFFVGNWKIFEFVGS